MADSTEYMKKVMQVLTNNPTASELDFLVEAHAKIGYMASSAEGDADMAYAIRKNEEASAYKRIISGPEKVTASAAERLAELEVYDLRMNEIEAKTRAKKISNLLQSVTEAINAIKFLGRLAG